MLVNFIYLFATFFVAARLEHKIDKIIGEAHNLSPTLVKILSHLCVL